MGHLIDETFYRCDISKMRQLIDETFYKWEITEKRHFAKISEPKIVVTIIFILFNLFFRKL